jgi:hypothetical protein
VGETSEIRAFLERAKTKGISDDAVTRPAYGYRPKENSKYQLCATFSGASP